MHGIKAHHRIAANFVLFLQISLFSILSIPTTVLANSNFDCPGKTNIEFDNKNSLDFLGFLRSKSLFQHNKTDFFIAESKLENGMTFKQFVAVHNVGEDDPILDISYILDDDGKRSGILYNLGMIALYSDHILPCLEKQVPDKSPAYLSHYTYDTSFYTQAERSSNGALPPLFTTIFANRPQFASSDDQKIPWKPKYVVNGWHLNPYIEKEWALTINEARMRRDKISRESTEKARLDRLTPNERIAEISRQEEKEKQAITSKGFIFRDRFYWQNYTYAKEIKGILNGTLDIRTSLFPLFLTGYANRFHNVCGKNFPSTPIYRRYLEYKDLEANPHMLKAIERDMIYLYENEGCQSPFMEQFRENMARLITGRKVLQEEKNTFFDYAQRDSHYPSYPQGLKRACIKYQEFREVSYGLTVAAKGFWCQCIQDQFEDILSPVQYKKAVDDYETFSRMISAVPKGSWTYYNAHTECVKCNDNKYYDCMKIRNRNRGWNTYSKLTQYLEDGRFGAIETDSLFRNYYRSFVLSYALNCPKKIVEKVAISEQDNLFVEKKYYNFYVQGEGIDVLAELMRNYVADPMHFSLNTGKSLWESYVFTEQYIGGKCEDENVKTTYENLYRKANGLAPVSQ